MTSRPRRCRSPSRASCCDITCRSASCREQMGSSLPSAARGMKGSEAPSSRSFVPRLGRSNTCRTSRCPFRPVAQTALPLQQPQAMAAASPLRSLVPSAAMECGGRKDGTGPSRERTFARSALPITGFPSQLPRQCRLTSRSAVLWPPASPRGDKYGRSGHFSPSRCRLTWHRSSCPLAFLR